MSLCRDMMPPWELRAEMERLTVENERLAAEAVRLGEALEQERRKKKLWRGWYDNEVAVADCLRQQLAEARAALSQKESTP